MPTSCWWGSFTLTRPSICCRPVCWQGLTRCRADGRALVLSMEQFSRADQPVLDAYLAGRIGESALIRDGMPGPTTRVITALWWSSPRRSTCQ